MEPDGRPLPTPGPPADDRSAQDRLARDRATAALDLTAGPPLDEAGVRHQLTAAGRLASIGYFSADLATDELWLDERSREILGAETGTGRFGQLLSSLLGRLHDDDVEDVRRAVKPAASGGGVFDVRGRVSARTGDGPTGHRWLAASGHVEVDAGGVTSLSGALLDHTDDRLREERWLRGQKREALGALAAGIAHDLNNVMGAILGNTALAQQEMRDGQSPATSIREVEQATRRAGEMLRRLLNFGREDTPTRTTFRLAEIIDEACTLLAPTLHDGIQVSRPDPRTEGWALGDPAQIHQLIINVVTNAAFVLPQGGRITITLEADPPPASTLRMAISDTGPGIPEVLLPRIFDAFFTTKQPEDGTGLGLAAAVAIAEMHGGSISVQSVVDHGTTFTLLLPHAGPESGESAGPSDRMGRRGQARVALVAPDPRLGHRAIASMPSFGCIPIVFADAEAALAALDLDPAGFDALVSDASAPANPRELIRRARSLRSDLPVIVHAGPDAVLTPDEARALGADTWVPRPCPPSELCAAVLHLTR